MISCLINIELLKKVFQNFYSLFSDILGKKMANHMTGKSTMTESSNNLVEALWSLLLQEMKILVCSLKVSLTYLKELHQSTTV